MYYTPPPETQETQFDQEDEELPLQGRGMRQHRAPTRLSPSGPCQRRHRNRPQADE